MTNKKLRKQLKKLYSQDLSFREYLGEAVRRDLFATVKVDTYITEYEGQPQKRYFIDLVIYDPMRQEFPGESSETTLEAALRDTMKRYRKSLKDKEE